MSANKYMKKVKPPGVISGWAIIYRKEKHLKHFGVKISVEVRACKTWTVIFREMAF